VGVNCLLTSSQSSSRQHKTVHVSTDVPTKQSEHHATAVFTVVCRKCPAKFLCWMRHFRIEMFFGQSSLAQRWIYTCDCHDSYKRVVRSGPCTAPTAFLFSLLSDDAFQNV